MKNNYFCLNAHTLTTKEAATSAHFTISTSSRSCCHYNVMANFQQQAIGGIGHPNDHSSMQQPKSHLLPVTNAQMLTIQKQQQQQQQQQQ